MSEVVRLGPWGSPFTDCESCMAVPTPALFDTLATLPDPRRRQGQVHPLPPILGLVALGLLLGRPYGVLLAHALGFRRGRLRPRPLS